MFPFTNQNTNFSRLSEQVLAPTEHRLRYDTYTLHLKKRPATKDSTIKKSGDKKKNSGLFHCSTFSSRTFIALGLLYFDLSSLDHSRWTFRGRTFSRRTFRGLAFCRRTFRSLTFRRRTLRGLTLRRWTFRGWKFRGWTFRYWTFEAGPFSLNLSRTDLSRPELSSLDLSRRFVLLV